MVGACRATWRRASVGRFPFIFAAVLLARRGRAKEASALLEHAAGNTFAGVLRRYLVKTGRLGVPSRRRDSADTLNVWTSTALSEKEMVATVRAFTGLLSGADASPVGSVPAILDIGTGNGILICRFINRLISAYRLKDLHLILLDRSEAMLREALLNCQRLVRLRLRVSTIHCPIESLSERQIVRLGKENLWFATAASCLHHLPRDLKVTTLATVRRLASLVLLEELEGNHDLPDRDSLELVWSVQRFYGALIRSVLRTNVSQAQQEGCIDQFLLAEAMRILTRAKSRRGDHHTSRGEWCSVAREAGFASVEGLATELGSHGPCCLTFRLRAEI